MFEYSICNMADDNIFKKQCAALEKAIHPLEKEKLLTDVDGSNIQRYSYNDKKIVVYNSYVENEVFIKSDIQLEQFFD